MKFYVLKKPKADTPEDLLGRIDIIEAEGTETGDFLKCPRCNYALTMRAWLPPHRAELETWGQHYGDVAQVSDELVVSERFVQLFLHNGLQGLSDFRPVQILKVIHRGPVLKETLPRYFKATIQHSATTVDQEASGYVWADRSAVCPLCLHGGDVKRYSRVVVDEKSWTGEDIFWPRGGPCIITSERFKNFCDKNAILGVAFGLPENESYDFYPWESK